MMLEPAENIQAEPTKDRRVRYPLAIAAGYGLLLVMAAVMWAGVALVLKGLC